MQRFETQRRHSQRGMSLAETLLALLVFTVVFLSALALYQAASKAYTSTDAATVQQQNARFALDRMTENIRDAGASVNPLGKSTLADEQIEGAWQSAIFMRADYDSGRETALESATHPMITTGNDEIVGYVLQKAGGGAYTIDVKMDLTPATGRDALKAAAPTSEETATVRVAARTLAEQTDPPYDLTRVTFNAAGSPQYQVIATNIFRLSYTYQNAAGTTIIGTGFGAYGAADAERDGRANIRRIGIDLITMADRPDFGFRDTKTYTPAEGAATKNRRKFRLTQQIMASNLGLKGSRHYNLPSEHIDAPPQLKVCVGHNLYYYIKWTASPTAGITNYTVKITAASPPINTSTDAIGVTEIRWKQTEPTLQAYTFAVAGVSGASVGDYSSNAVITSWHDLTNSKPSVPTGVAAGAGSGNTMALSWNAVTTNSATVTSSTACTTVGTSPGPSAPTSPWNTEAPDMKEYRVYRGLLCPSCPAPAIPNGNSLTATDPGYRVDNVPYAGISNTTPTTNAFTDNTAAPCSEYYYRIKAFDTANLSTAGDGSATLGSSARFIPAAGILPGTPPAPAPVGGVVATPATSTVTLAWPHVNVDSTGRPAATAHYILVRQKNINSTGWQADTSSNYYETNSTSAITVPNLTSPGNLAIKYRFAVLAQYDCGAVGDTNRTTALPTPDTNPNWYYLTCSFTPSITPSGQSSGDGSYGNPWVMDQGDTVRVGVAGTVSNVQFTLREEGTNVIIVPAAVDSTDPFEFVYSNQVDNVVYRLEVKATSPTGCAYTNNFYISDAPPTPACLFGTTVIANPATHDLQDNGNNCASGTPGYPGKGSNKTSFSEFTYTITNSSPSEALTLQAIKIDWARDTNHSDAVLAGITFPKTGGGTVNLAPGSNSPPSTNEVNVPANTLVIPAGATSYQIKVKFTFNSCDLLMPNSPPPVSKFCLIYRSPVTGTQDRKCNIIGTTTGNPTNCN